MTQDHRAMGLRDVPEYANGCARKVVGANPTVSEVTGAASTCSIPSHIRSLNATTDTALPSCAPSNGSAAKTPRTDAEAVTDETICERNYLPNGWVPADFCRTIEAELNQLLTAFRHRHVNNGEDDACKACGFDLRHEIHERVIAQPND